jgi:hypothetical protein
MPGRVLRLVHAAHLRLDACLAPPGPVEDDLQTLLADATITAFERITALALEQDADALILTGNTFDAATPSLSAEVALQREFRKLHEHGLPVLITPGLLDPSAAWQELPGLPENVTVFLKGNEPGVELTDRGRRMATILPVSPRSGVEPPELERLRSLAANHGENRGFTIGLWIPDPASHAPSPTRFSSLDLLLAGDSALADSLPLTEGHSHLQAGPQGLHAGETGWRGCQVIDVDENGDIETRLAPTAPVRWETCIIDGRGVADTDGLCERMLAQLEALPGYSGEQLRIVTWPLDPADLEPIGLDTDDDLAGLAAMLRELSDQPKNGLRYWHRVQTRWDETDVPPAVDRELWQDYLMELDRWSPLEMDRLRKLWEQQTGSGAAPAGWPNDVVWPPVNPDHVRRRALQNGRRWFRQTGAVR